MEPSLVVSTSSYDSAFPNFDKPSVIGEYCVTKDRDVVPGKKFMRYLNEKLLEEGECKLDLSEGYSSFEKKDELVNEKLDVFLKWITMNAPPGKRLKEVCCNCDIVCWRGLLTKIAAFPYEKREGFRVAAVRFKSTIFLCEFRTDDSIKRIMSATKREQLMTYWGFKFEQCVTVAAPGGHGSRDTSEPVNSLEQFSIVFRTTLGKPDKVRIFSSAEVDCVDAKDEYVELKTQRETFNDSFWRHKALKWWLQSFLVGISDIIVGFRNDNGIVLQTERVKVSSLTHRKNHWSANVAFNFLHSALKMIKDRLDSAAEMEYFLIDFIPGRAKLNLHPLPPHLPYNFLPEFFIKHFETL